MMLTIGRILGSVFFLTGMLLYAVSGDPESGISSVFIMACGTFVIAVTSDLLGR